MAGAAPSGGPPRGTRQPHPGAIRGLGVPTAVLPDSRSRLAGRDCHRKQAGAWTPTAFEGRLPAPDTGLINPRPYRPQTNGKTEPFHKDPEDYPEPRQSGRLYRVS